MAETNTASIIPLHQPRAMTGAERARAYRARKAKAKAAQATAPAPAPVAVTVAPTVTPVPSPVTRVTAVTSDVTLPKTIAPAVLTLAAFGLAAVGVTMNGWFAKSLGSSDIAGWLFLAIGVAADAVALAVPACAARLWRARQRGAAVTGWLIWAATFAFAVTAGIGFASVNISDVTLARASRVTPAVTAAQAALADALVSRDRECTGGVGKFCRAREDAVTERRRALDAATAAVQVTADPQIEAATKVAAWVSFGWLKPSSDDFAMLRLVLLALLPQVGGLLLMVARGAK